MQFLAIFTLFLQILPILYGANASKFTYKRKKITKNVMASFQAAVTATATKWGGLLSCEFSIFQETI